MVGCVAETPELAHWFGDDIVFRRDGFEVDFAGLPKQALAHLRARPIPIPQRQSPTKTP